MLSDKLRDSLIIHIILGRDDRKYDASGLLDVADGELLYEL